jgi:pentatricopeptide repeat protein
MHEYAKEAHGHFEQMLEKGGEINHITFVSLLSACSYACLVDEGLHYFDLMSSCFSISATVEHYAFTVDLLGYIGHLQEAEHLIMPMSCEPNTTVWTVLLHACKSHGNVEMGECVAKQAMQIGPGNAFYRRQQVSDPKMACEPNADLWMVLLGACRSHHNVAFDDSWKELPP